MAGKNKKLMKRTFLTGSALAVLLSAGILLGCSGDIGIADAQDPGRGARATQEISERGSGEHGGAGEGAEGGAASGASGSEEDSGANLAPNDTFDAVRGGARLILNYDAPSNSFIGVVENTTSNILDRVRVEVHLSNGTELGPTTPVNMAPGEVLWVSLLATQASFTGWIAHAEVGGGEGSQPGGEHGSGNRSGGEHGRGNRSSGEHSGSGESGGEHGGRGERRGGG